MGRAVRVTGIRSLERDQRALVRLGANGVWKSPGDEKAVAAVYEGFFGAGAVTHILRVGLSHEEGL